MLLLHVSGRAEAKVSEQTTGSPLALATPSRRLLTKLDETAKKITIESKADIDITATGNLNMTATGNVKLEGAQVSINGKSQFEVKGALGKVEASGPLTVKGAIVNIN